MLATFLFTLLWSIVFSQFLWDDSDGCENKICARLTDFEVDGDWYADYGCNVSSVDWSTLLDGDRRVRDSGGEFANFQNQCYQTGHLWKYMIKAAVFCDTYKADKSCITNPKNKFESECCPDKWIPLQDAQMLSKNDILNVYYAGSSVDMILCAGVERVGTSGASYFDFEFDSAKIDGFNDSIAEHTVLCNETTGTLWKCEYPLRSPGDIQISYELQNNLAASTIAIYEWVDAGTGNPTDNGYEIVIPPIDMSLSPDPFYYESVDGGFRVGSNQYIVNASVYGYICDVTTGATCPTIPAKAFFEACIDFKALGFDQVSFSNLVIKARTSATGAYKDTSGVLGMAISGPVDPPTGALIDCGLSNDPTESPSIPPTPAPQSPTAATEVPTTATPTAATTNPTRNPSGSPTVSTGIPTYVPTGSPTYNPTTSPTKNPTTSPSKNPTYNPSTSPTASTGNPTTSQPTAPTTISYPTATSDNPTSSPITSSPTADTASPTTSSPTDATQSPTKGPTDSPHILTTNCEDGDCDNQGEDKTSGGFAPGTTSFLIVMIIIGVIVCVALIILIWFCTKKRKSRRLSEFGSYGTEMN